MNKRIQEKIINDLEEALSYIRYDDWETAFRLSSGASEAIFRLLYIGKKQWIEEQIKEYEKLL